MTSFSSITLSVHVEKIEKEIIFQTMDNFEEYIRQGEPNKAEKAKV
jgi:hypothetical protein